MDYTTLGQQLKAENPGKYDSFDDSDLGSQYASQNPQYAPPPSVQAPDTQAHYTGDFNAQSAGLGGFSGSDNSKNFGAANPVATAQPQQNQPGGFAQLWHNITQPYTLDQANADNIQRGSDSYLKTVGETFLNAGRGALSTVGGIGQAGVLGIGGLAEGAYDGITGQDHSKVWDGEKFVRALPGAIKQGAQGLGDFAKEAVRDPSSAAYDAYDFLYSNPINALLAASGLGDGVAAAGKIGSSLADSAALSAAVKSTGLTGEAAATATLGGSSPLGSILGSVGSTGQSVAKYLNPLLGANAVASTASVAPNFAVRTAANISGKLSKTDPEALLQHFIDPSGMQAAAQEIATTGNPYTLVQNVNDAVSATAAARKAAYEQNQAQFLGSIPENHPFNGLTDQSPQELYQPQTLQAAMQTLGERGVDVTTPNAQDFADMQRLGDLAQQGQFGNGYQHTADTPFGTAGTGNGYRNYDTTGYMADSNRFNQLLAQYGIKPNANPGSGFGFTNRSQLGQAPVLAQKGAAMSEFASTGAQPQFSFPAGMTDIEQNQLQSAYSKVANNKDWTANGINDLKKSLQNLQRPGDYTNQANSMIGQITDAVKQPLTQFPEYNDMNARYAQDSQMLDMMRGIIKNPNNVGPDQQLSSLMRAVKSKNPITQDVLQRIYDNTPDGASDFRNQIAAYQTMPTGLRTPTGSELSMGAAMPHTIPAIIGSIIASNPSNQAKIFTSLGKMAQFPGGQFAANARNTATSPGLNALLDQISKNQNQ